MNYKNNTHCNWTEAIQKVFLCPKNAFQIVEFIIQICVLNSTIQKVFLCLENDFRIVEFEI